MKQVLPRDKRFFHRRFLSSQGEYYEEKFEQFSEL